LLAFSLLVFGLESGGAQDGVKKDAAVKDKATKDKFEIPRTALSGKVKAVDLKEPSFTITLKGGKDRKFKVDDKTEFYGPKGGDRGTGAEGLKDDCMGKGYEIKVVASKDGKTAKEVYLPVRKSENDKDAKKDAK